MNNFAPGADNAVQRSLPDSRASNAAIPFAIRPGAVLAVALVLTGVGCARQQVDDNNGQDSRQSQTSFATDPPELPVSDFTELGFSLNAASFNVVPDSATRRVWPNGYLLESATWRGENGFPRIMINVLDVSQSGETFTRSSQLVKPTSDRINDLLPGEEINMRAAGHLQNNYGRTNFQMFTVDSRMGCAFMNQFLTHDPIKNNSENNSNNDFGEIIFEAILCDQNTTQINRRYLERFTNAYRIGKTSL